MRFHEADGDGTRGVESEDDEKNDEKETSGKC